MSSQDNKRKVGDGEIQPISNWSFSSLVMLDFSLPIPPKELHPNKRHKISAVNIRKKQEYQQHAGLLVRERRQQFEDRKIQLPIKHAMVVSRFALPSTLAQHQHDKDNLSAWLKHVTDLFEIEGIIENDRHLFHKTPRQVVGAQPKLDVSLFVLDGHANELITKVIDNIKLLDIGSSARAFLKTVLEFRE